MGRTWQIAAALAACLCPGWAAGQSLTPLADQVHDPMLPTGISRGDVEFFGQRVYVYPAEDGTEVIHVVGDFELHLGHRRYLSANEAVAWMTPRTYGDQPYRHFEVYLWRRAQVEESAGTVTSGPVLYVVLNSFGQVSIGADDTTTASSSESPVYTEAVRVRQRLAQALDEDVESQPPVQVFDPEAAPRRDQPAVRPALYIGPSDKQWGEIDGRPVLTAIGNVYLFQGAPDGSDSLELRADAAVLFMSAEAEAPTEAPTDPGEPLAPPRDLIEKQDGPTPFDAGQLGSNELLSGTDVEGVYLEGDVVLTRGERMIRAERLYYDLANDRALILDSVGRLIEPTRDVPIYVRAEQVRQLGRTEYAAWNAKVTTSEFHSPHYHVGAKEMRFTDRTTQSVSGVSAGLRAGTYEMKHTTFNLGGVPLFYWPYARGDFKEGETTIRGIRTGYSSDFGATFETEWHLFNVLAVETPPGFDGTLRLDYYTERGPGAGVDLDYERDDYFGLYRGYYLHDDGRDNLGRFRDETPDRTERGRSTLRHRHYLPDDWEVTLEASYITDRGFLEEYFESEFEQGKDQETLLYVKKQRANWALTGLAQWRILDFVTQTEHLPEIAFHLIAQPIGTWGTLFSENRAGFVRYRPGERELLEYIFLRPREDASGMVARADSRQELEIPFSLGPVRIVPFGAVRGTVWDDSRQANWNDWDEPEASHRSGGEQRIMGTAGVRSSMYLWRDFPDLHSQLLDINGIRHIIKLDAAAWVAGANVEAHELFPFTPNIEDLDDVSGATFGIRQRWRTRRGGPGRYRNVDVLTLDLEVGAFDNAQSYETTNGFASYSRPENSISRNYLNAAATYRVNDATALLSEANFDLNDNELDVFNLAVVVERDPRFSFLLAYRFINEIDSSLLAFGANYRISEKHTLAIRESFDLDRGQTQEFAIGFIRKFPRWYVGLSVDLNEADDEFGVSLSAWPEGLRQATLGSRRFTGLARSTGIRPE
ncbi:MAG: LPS-assembly protein LptD [bacterium]|nr:LPS-assembly protein LptD [bacterium]